MPESDVTRELLLYLSDDPPVDLSAAPQSSSRGVAISMCLWLRMVFTMFIAEKTIHNRSPTFVC